MTDLVERLRARDESWRRYSYGNDGHLAYFGKGDAQLCGEAADTLDRQRAEIEKLRGALREAIEVVTLQIDFYLRDGKKDIAAALIRRRTELSTALGETQP